MVAGLNLKILLDRNKTFQNFYEAYFQEASLLEVPKYDSFEDQLSDVGLIRNSASSLFNTVYSSEVMYLYSEDILHVHKYFIGKNEHEMLNIHKSVEEKKFLSKYWKWKKTWSKWLHLHYTTCSNIGVYLKLQELEGRYFKISPVFSIGISK